MVLKIDSEYLFFYNFYKEAFKVLNPSTPFIDNWHLRHICERLQYETYRIALGLPKTKDLIINVPFRTGKSEITSVCWNAWSWIIHPSMSFLTVSYSASLSTEHARLTRNLIGSDWYQENFGHIYSISAGQKAKGNFSNSKTGERFATSTTGSGTGKGGDVILFDDPMNPKEAESDKERATANKAYSETFYSRTKNPETAVRVVIMQRLHQDDTTGYLLSRNPDEYDHICIPAEISENVKPVSLREKYQDGLFWPNRFTPEILSSYKKELGSYAYAGQLQQTPSPSDGGIWQKWLIPIARKDMPHPTALRNHGTDWDTAFTDREVNAANAYVTAANWNNDVYIYDAGHFWAESPELIERMKRMVGTHYVENKASGISVVQILKRSGINAVAVDMDKGDKIARTRGVTPIAESGRVFVAEDLLDYIYNDDKQGILRFPNGSHKDLNDAFVQALNRIGVQKPIDYNLLHTEISSSL